MTSLFVELTRTTLAVLLVAYTIVAIGHFVLQLVYAHRTYRRQGSPQFAEDYPGIEVSVDILVPVYNEDPALLEACLASAIAQDHRGSTQLIVVDDGSPNRAALDDIYDRYEELGARVVRSPTNVGKRRAQALGLRLCVGEILITLDSDSVLMPDAVRMLTRQFADPKIGAATGFVDVANRSANLLTRIQRVRYWMAFNQERAAQTWFRTVMCCSGPLAAYRRTIVDTVRDDYLAQTYGGVECTYGDDRHLTNLVLGQGYDTVYDSGAVALTNVPTSLGGFLRQQLRWNKSFYRELIWSVPYLGSRPWFTRLDVACQVAMPVMLTITAGSALILGVLSSSLYLIRYIAFIAIAAVVRSTYAVLRQRDLRFYLFVLYGYISAFLLMSVRLRALGTLTDARWGTRGPVVVGRAGAAVAGLVASLQPLRVATEAASWPELRPRRWGGGAARLDGAWRAGTRTRMMAYPSAADDVALPVVTANLVVVGAATDASMAPGWQMMPPDPGARLAQPVATGRPRTPTYISPLPPGHHLHPLGAWRIGPTCRHAVARSGSAFCPACGARPGPVFDPAPTPTRALHERMAEKGAEQAARAAAIAAASLASEAQIEVPRTRTRNAARRSPEDKRSLGTSARRSRPATSTKAPGRAAKANPASPSTSAKTRATTPKFAAAMKPATRSALTGKPAAAPKATTAPRPATKRAAAPTPAKRASTSTGRATSARAGTKAAKPAAKPAATTTKPGITKPAITKPATTKAAARKPAAPNGTRPTRTPTGAAATPPSKPTREPAPTRKRSRGAA